MDTFIIAITAFVIGYQFAWWGRGRLEQSTRKAVHKAAQWEIEKARAKLEADAQEAAAEEYERGCRDGWESGLNHGVLAARAVVNNKRVLTELAARRFLVGGLRANE